MIQKEGRFGLKIIYPDDYAEKYFNGLATIEFCSKCKYYENNKQQTWYCLYRNDKSKFLMPNNKRFMRDGFELHPLCPYKFEAEYLSEFDEK